MNAKLLAFNTIGFEVKTIADIVKAQELGLRITDKDGNEYNYYVTYEDDNGEECEREPTKDEVFSRISEDMKNGNQLYASIRLNERWNICEHKATNLQSDFYLGQEVFTMQDNKIIKGKIAHLSLAISENRDKLIVDYKSHDISERLYNIIGGELCPTGYKAYWALDRRMNIESAVKSAINDNTAILNIDNNKKMVTRNFDEIFATKEELVKHLMEED